MQIKVKHFTLDGIPCIVIATDGWSCHDLDAMVQFGEPSVEIGGRFYKHPCHHDDESEDSSDLPDCESYWETEEYFDIPCQEKGIKTGFPVMMKFDTEHFEDPLKASTIWAEEVSRRIAFQVKWLRNLACVTRKEEVYEV